MPVPQKISIIIPTLNEEEQIGGLLEQLVAWPGIEIIVSDGGSRDETVKICRRYPVQVLNSAPGRGVQLNTGAQKASGDILFFLHADSVIEERTLTDIRAALSRGYQWGCCTLAFNDKSIFFSIIALFSNLRARCLSSCYGDQGIFCQRDLFFQAGQFPEMVFLEDLEFSRTLRRLKRAHVITGKVETSARRFYEGGLLRTICKMQVIKILYRLGVKPERLLQWYGVNPRKVG